MPNGALFTTSPTLALAPWVVPSLQVAGITAGLISIPIIIHLLNRQRFRVVWWAAMDFLLRAMRKNRKRLRFEQLLLLATRCLLITLFYIAFAWLVLMTIFEQAGCTKPSFAGLGSRSGLNVIIIDNSYSTRYEANRADAKTHLDQEKIIAKRLIDGLQGGGEGVVLITTAEPAARVLAKPSYDLNGVKSIIDLIEPSYAATDLAGALRAAVDVANEETKGMNKRLYILTDGTKSAWEGRQADAIKQAGAELAKQYKITHFNMSEGRQQVNAAALSLKPDGNLVTTKFDTELLTDVKGFGAIGDTQLRWTLDGNPLGDTKVLKLHPTHDPVSVEIKSNQIKTGGPRVAVASLGGDRGADPLPIDDKRFRIMDVAAELKVLIVEGTRGQTALDGSGAFLQLALSPPAADAGPGVTRTNSYITAELISDIELRTKPLNDFRCVVLCGVGQVSDAEAESLRGFVESGGTLIMFMGEPIDKQNYNSTMLPRKLLPGPLVTLIGPNETGFLFDFAPAKQQHRFLKLFERHENTGLDTAKVFNYWQVDVAPESNVERVLSYKAAADATPGGGTVRTVTPDPAITNHAVGLGNVIFISTTASPKWTSLPAKMVYVEMMHEMITGGVRPGDYWMNLTVGQTLEIPSFVKLGGAPTLKDESNVQVLIDPVTERDPKTGQQLPPVYRSKPLTKPGLYTLDLGNATVPIAVNLPPDEADVRPLGNEQIQKALGVPMALLNDQVPSDAALFSESDDVTGWLLAAVLVLLALEAFMAMSFGHYRRADVARTSAAAS